MPEIVSMTLRGLLLGAQALAARSQTSTALSGEAGFVSKTAAGISERAEQPQAFDRERSALLSNLISVVNESNGEIAQARVTDETLVVAIEFVRAIPAGWPLPEPSTEPDGAIAFDWISSRHRQLSVSVTTGRRLAFAWLDGVRRGHGVSSFDGVSIPGDVAERVRSIMVGEHASFRA